MEALQADHLRKVLTDLIDKDGRFDATTLARKIGRGEGYLRDFLRGRKDSLGGVEMRKIEELYGLPPGSLMSADDLKPAHKDNPGNPQKKSLVGYFDPDEPDKQLHEPRMLEGQYGRDVGDAPPDAILQIDTSLGMGGGGLTHISELLAEDGTSYGAEGIADWWVLPRDYVRGTFHVPTRRVRCFRSHGDSMEPTVKRGDIVFIDIGHRIPTPPGVYVLSDPFGGLVLKRLEIISPPGVEPIRLLEISDNPRHPQHERTVDEIHIAGRYLGRLTTE
jgi:hypothetical protein